MLDALDAPRVERSQARRREVGYTFAGLALLSLGLALNLDRLESEELDVDAPVAARLAVIYAATPEVQAPDPPPPPPPASASPVQGMAAGLPGGVPGGLARAVASEIEAPSTVSHGASGKFVRTRRDPKSTFSIDVDTASYSRIRERLRVSSRIDPKAVRVEEMINYFEYDLAEPSDGAPFSVHAEVGPCPWNPEHRLARVALQAKAVPPPKAGRNLVYLIDTSGSMTDALSMVTHGLTALAEILGPEDRVSIVTYAGSAGLVLPPTPGDQHATIGKALGWLQAGGGTNGAGGIELAYALAEDNFVAGGINRVVLATDGDFNVGVSDHDALIELIERKRETGVFLSVLGFQSYGNDHMLEQLADHGNGNYAYIDGKAEAERVLVEDADATLVTVARDVKIQVQLDPKRVAQHRLAGYLNRRLEHRDFRDDTKDAGELGSGQTVTALYELVPTPNADDEGPWLSVRTRHRPMDGGPVRSSGVEGWRTRVPGRDFRWAAAVAWFGRLLAEDQGGSIGEWQTVYALAAGSLGDDRTGRRCEMLDLITRGAGGRFEAEPPEQCRRPPEKEEPPEPPTETVEVDQPVPTPVEQPTREPEPAPAEPEPEEETPAWLLFVWETLRLLPPLLALPMFVLAYRSPRRPPHRE